MSTLRHILLVEDDEVDVMNVRRAFKRTDVDLGLSVRGNGVEALRALREREVPSDGLLVLLDLNMPKMSGIEFLKELRKDQTLHSLPVVVLTSSDHEKDRVEAYDLNVAGYIVKPVTFDKFVEVVKRLKEYWTIVRFP